MDLSKAKRLLAKINVLVDHYDGTYSNLEKDLLRSYIQDLYGTFGGNNLTENIGVIPPPSPKIQIDTDLQVPKSDPIVELKPNNSTSNGAPKNPATDVPNEEKINKEPLVDLSSLQDEMEGMKEFVEEKIDVVNTNFEKVGEVTDAESNPISQEIDDVLLGLFKMKQADDLQSKLSEKPIDRIEMAMGINERIFTINELFGADQTLFKNTVAALNNMSSFEEAKSYLINGVATEQNWKEESKQKKAEKFVRLVWRKYAQHN